MAYSSPVDFYGLTNEGYANIPGAIDICGVGYTLLHMAARDYSSERKRSIYTDKSGGLVFCGGYTTLKDANILPPIIGMALMYRTYNVVRTFGYS